MVDGRERAFIETSRFLAGELAPAYKVTEDSTVGMYYLYGYGMDHTAIKHPFCGGQQQL